MYKTTSVRIAVLTVAVALFGAACSSGSESSDTTATSSTSTTSTSTTLPAATTTTTEAPMGPTELALSPVEIADDDPLLTVEQLESVLVDDVDGVLVVTFGPPQFGLNVGIEDVDGNRIECGPNLDGNQQCSVFMTDGSFDSEVYDLGDLTIDETMVGFPAAVSGPQGSITIEVNGVSYTSQVIKFMDGPLFVQIDPGTGGLSEPVTRIMGQATAAELAAALG
jgi:hypothetical protein